MGKNEVKLFGFCGRKRSGKGFFSNIVKDKYDGEIVTVANYLKLLCCDLLDCGLDTLNRLKDDGTKFLRIPDSRWYRLISERTGIDVEAIKKDIGRIEFTNVRQMLQVIGTDCIRKHNPDWHVNCMVEEIKQHLSNGKTVAVDDVRFPNEREAIEELGGVCYFVIRPIIQGVSNHISETSLSWDMFDKEHVILNQYNAESMETEFRRYLDGDCNLLTLLLSDETFEQNLRFGMEKNDLVEEILEQNKSFDIPHYYGYFSFVPKNREMHVKFREQVLNINTPDSLTEESQYLIYNPVILENLKRYM